MDLSLGFFVVVVPFIYIPVFVPVPYCPDDYSFEVRQDDSSSSILLSQDCYSRLFVFPYKL